MIYVGIDPGVAGGIAFIDTVLSIVAAHRMPLTLPGLWYLLQTRPGVGGVVAVVEDVGPGVFAPGVKMGSKSAFTFGRGVGNIEAFLTAADIPFERVTPLHWQTAMNCRTKGDKNVTKAAAAALFPAMAITHAIADALLIAEFARQSQIVEKAQKMRGNTAPPAQEH